jgi:hypothetical protein
VTSAKLSPQGQMALVGYGVRSQGIVEDHAHSMVRGRTFSLFLSLAPLCLIYTRDHTHSHTLIPAIRPTSVHIHLLPYPPSWSIYM